MHQMMVQGGRQDMPAKAALWQPQQRMMIVQGAKKTRQDAPAKADGAGGTKKTRQLMPAKAALCLPQQCTMMVQGAKIKTRMRAKAAHDDGAANIQHYLNQGEPF